jgi:hypothetical protein
MQAKKLDGELFHDADCQTNGAGAALVAPARVSAALLVVETPIV